MSDAGRDPWDQLDAAWSERFDGLAQVLDKVVALQQELVKALGELQEDVFSLAPPRIGPADGDTRGGLRAQARQSQQRASRLIERASELAADAERLRTEAATLSHRRSEARATGPS